MSNWQQFPRGPAAAPAPAAAAFHGSMPDQRPFVGYFARQGARDRTWPRPEAFEASPKPPLPPKPPQPPSAMLFVGCACVDVVMGVDAYPAEDACCRAASLRRCRGGNAANSSVIASQCGVQTTWLGTLCQQDSPDARFIVEDLEACGVRVAPVYDAATHAPTSHIVASKTSRTIVHCRGLLPELAEGDFPPCDGSDGTDDDDDVTWAHFEGRSNVNEIRSAMRRYRASGLSVSVELEKVDEALDALEDEADVVLYSKERAERDGYRDPVKFLAKKASDFCVRGQTHKTLTCAWGAHGAAACSIRGRPGGTFAITVLRAGVLEAEVVETVGCGDTFNGAFLSCLAMGDDAGGHGLLGRALRVASHVAGQKVGRVGFAGLEYPSVEDCSKIWLEVAVQRGSK